VPEFNPGFGHIGIFAVTMAMPETAVYEYYCSVFWQNNIRCPGKLLLMQAKSVSHFMHKGPNRFFGGSVLAANTRHIPAPVFAGYTVDHYDS